ncbi:MAG TPA: pyridoxal phosphate-dependent aminotransferase, partial [Candidatus Acidoferrum sp.]|nr:pyridoxal phosphate-dependent aminotransferase [Candidatus Acidoferrum sp.]
MRPSNRVENIPRSGIRAIFDQARGIPDLIHLELGEPDFRIPDHATDAAIQALSDGFTKYTPNAGIDDLRQAISEKLKRENEIHADPNGEIMVTAGAMEALSLSILCTVDQGDEVLIPDPGYVSYEAHVLLAGGVPKFVPLREQNDFRMRAEDIENLINKKTRMIILNSPSNPTGAVELLEDLKDIADLAQKHDLLVLSDEPYERLVYKGHDHHSIAALPGMLEQTVSIFSFSKTYAMTGMRIGYIASGRELVQHMIKMQEHFVGSINSPAQKAAIAALRGPQTCVTDMLNEYTRRREILIDGLNETGVITCKKPAGTFYAFPNITKTGFDSKTFAEKLLKEAKVVTVPGVAFGPHGEGHLRLSFATSITNVTEAVKRIRDYCIKI